MSNTDTVLNISLAQYDIVWEDKDANLAYVEDLASSLSGTSDVLVVPEMFSTGFTMNAHPLAEDTNGETIGRLKKIATDYSIAICGSYIAKDGDKYYNRAFFITADQEFYYDKHHLFRMGNEAEIYSAGEKRIVFEHKGFKICLQVCYDLRFPVWVRNVDNEYDLLIYVGNWPKARTRVWNILLAARAIENMCYVCGVNRIGVDGMNIDYDGQSKLLDAKGIELSSIQPNEEKVETIQLSKKELSDFRTKFPAWRDGDKFELK